VDCFLIDLLTDCLWALKNCSQSQSLKDGDLDLPKEEKNIYFIYKRKNTFILKEKKHILGI